MKLKAILIFSVISLLTFKGYGNKPYFDLSYLIKTGKYSFKPKNDKITFSISNKSNLNNTVYVRIGTENLYKYHSIDVFRIEAGYNYAVYLTINNKILLENGPLIPYYKRKNQPDMQTFKIQMQPNEVYGFNIKVINEGLKNSDHTIQIYSPEAFYEVKNKELSEVKPSLYVSLLFLGSIIIMILFSFLVYVQNKSKDFLSYAGYLTFVLIFSIIADFPIKFNTLFIWDYPKIFLQSKEVFVYSYLIFYHAFLAHFLNLKQRLNGIYKGLKLINYFFICLILLNLGLLLSTNILLQNIAFKINSVVLFAVIPYYGYIIYKLFKARNLNFFKFILWGILFFYLGNIGGTLSQIFGWRFIGLFPNNYTQIGTFFELCFFSLGLGGKMIDESREKIKYQKQILEVQMMALQSQMNPHFTFNCLNAIRNLVLQNQNEKASKYLLKFSKLLRLTLENSMQKQVSLSDNINYLEMYLSMESLRLGESLSFSITNNIEKESVNVFLPPMLVQPFVENAVKHAFVNNTLKKTVLISFTKEINNLLIKVEDNGMGINQHIKLKSSEYKSRATEITKNYLSQWSSLYNKKIDLKIVDKNDLDAENTGTLVSISLQLY